MKFKRIILTILTLTCLVGCNTRSFAGVYTFQMGKKRGAHFGVHLAIKDENTYEIKSPDGTSQVKNQPDNEHEWHVFELSLDADFNLQKDDNDSKEPANSETLLTQEPLFIEEPGEVTSDSGEEDDIDVELPDYLTGLEDIDLTMKGFFYLKTISDKKTNKNVMKMADVSILGIELPDEITEVIHTIMTASIENKKAILSIPVSFEDLEKQINYIAEQGDNYVEGSKPEKGDVNYFYTVDIVLLKE